MDTHRVRRLRWQARAKSPAEALDLRSLLREQIDACHAALGRVFDRAVPSHEVWRLPHLELKIQVADVRGLGMGGLAERVEAAALATLRAALAEARGMDTGAAAEGSAWTEGRPAVARRSVAAPVASSHPSAIAEDRQALQHYLRTGLLPWTLAGLAPAEAQHVLRGAALQAAESVLGGTESLDALLPPAGSDARIGALLRWLPLLPAALRRRWVAAARTQPVLPVGIVEAWRAWIDDDAVDRIEWQASWIALWQAPWPAGPLNVTRLRARVGLHDSATGVEPPFLPALREALRETLREASREAQRDTLRSLADSSLDVAIAASHESAADAVAIRPAAASAAAPPGQASAAAQSLLVPLAGLVLLHPWLPRLLAGCGVLDEGGKQIAPALLARACALLYAAACGDADAVEHQLPLVKLLLGRPPDEPLDVTLPALAPADREEIVALLDAVRDHWKALSGTGIDGLRLSFLQRRGLLTRGDGVWRLHIEGEAFDVLLDLLPWSVALIRLPWMPEPLMVEWPTP